MVLIASPNAFTFLRKAEGIRLTAYPDSGGVWTIGYGSTKWLDGTAVKAGQVCTLDQAEQLLEMKVNQFMSEVSKYTIVQPNQNQIDAIAAFVYNIGYPAFETSTFLKMLNQQNWAGASAQLVWQDANGVYHGWVNVDGQVNNGLVNRRKAEQVLFNTPVGNDLMSLWNGLELIANTLSRGV